jgi:hypothetical protein
MSLSDNECRQAFAFIEQLLNDSGLRWVPIFHDCVPQHATQGCVSTPMEALTTRIRWCGTSPDFALQTEVAAPEPIALYPRRPPQAILRSLKSHSHITASVAPATAAPKRLASTIQSRPWPPSFQQVTATPANNYVPKRSNCTAESVYSRPRILGNSGQSSARGT